MAEFTDFDIFDIDYKERMVTIESVIVEDEVVKDYVAETFDVDDVYGKAALEAWAEGSGYVRP